jgi:hypothetical protein
LASFAKNPSTALSHEHEVKSEAREASEPLAHLRMLVDGVIVEDYVNKLSGRHLSLNGIQEADELLVPMALHKSADNRAFEHVESSEQRRCAMTLVVVGHRPGATFFHRQAGLCAVEGLDLRLLINRKDDGVGGRIDIEPHDIAQLFDKLRVIGELNCRVRGVLLSPVNLDRFV